MACLEERYEPVALESCKIKRGRYSEQLEVMINPSTKLSVSPKKFDLRKISKMISGDVSISDVESKNAYEKVTIRAKVLRVQLPVDVSPGLKKQEITVAQDDLPDDTTTVSNVKIQGARMTSYVSCVACNSKVVPTPEENISKCTKCELDQLTSSCTTQVSATLHISTGSQFFSLTAFNNTLEAILEGQEITTINLLLATPFTCSYENNIIITAISRP